MWGNVSTLSSTEEAKQQGMYVYVLNILVYLAESSRVRSSNGKRSSSFFMIYYTFFIIIWTDTTNEDHTHYENIIVRTNAIIFVFNSS